MFTSLEVPPLASMIPKVHVSAEVAVPCMAGMTAPRLHDHKGWPVVRRPQSALGFPVDGGRSTVGWSGLQTSGQGGSDDPTANIQTNIQQFIPGMRWLPPC